MGKQPNWQRGKLERSIFSCLLFIFLLKLAHCSSHPSFFYTHLFLVTGVCDLSESVRLFSNGTISPIYGCTSADGLVVPSLNVTAILLRHGKKCPFYFCFW